MVHKHFTDDDESQLFVTPKEYNHSFTELSAQVMLGYDSLQYQHNITTDLFHPKMSPSF